MRTFSKISLGALFIALAASPAFAQLASQTYVERKASVSETAAADVGKIAVYAADGSGQKIVSGILANTILTTSDLTKVGLNGATAATGTFSFYAPTSAGTSGQVLTSNGTGAPTWWSLPAAYTLPTATTSILGGVKLGSDTVQTVAANAVGTATGRTYAIQPNGTGQLVVNVPWSDTVYTHPTSGVTPGSYGPGANATLTAGGTFTVPSFTTDANGHTTVAATRTMTMPADNDTIDGVTTGTTAGSANTYTLTGTGFVLTKGSHVVAKINAANTGAATLNVNSTGAKAIVFEDVALSAGMLKANTDYSFVYDGTSWQLLSDNDHITTATNSGSGNGVASVTADASGALTITKTNFLTSADLPDPYTLPTATSAILGGVKLNSDTVQSVAANAVSTATGKTYGIQNNSSGQMVVNVPWSDTNNSAFNGPSTAGTAAAYTLATTQPAFTASDLTAGSIVVATIHAANSANPTLSVGGQTAKPIFMIDTGAAAGASALAANTIYSFTYNGTNWYAKQIDTNTTYTGTAPITVTGTTISHNTSGVSAAAYGPTANATLTSGGTFTVPSFTVDTNGHTTVAATRTMTMPTIPVDTNTAANLNTTNTTAQTTNASESLLSGTVNLHKVAKTGTFSDLIGAPSIPTLPAGCTAANATCSLNFGQCTATENATGVACSGAQYYWEIVIR